MDATAAQTFAALFLAHVIADYLLQSSWLVENKRKPLALSVHIALVIATMIAVTGMVSPWFLLLAGMHLAIDVVKTFALPDGLGSYLLDQALHIGSIGLVVGFAPTLWAASPFAAVDALPLAYALAGGVIFAARGGQFAVALLLPQGEAPSIRGPLIGVMERAILAAGILSGTVWIGAAVIGAKLAFAAGLWRTAPALVRQRLLWGTAASFTWTLITAIPLARYLISAL